jgi:hypothetical protein
MRRWLRAITLTSFVLVLGMAAVAPVEAISRTGTWRGPTAEGHVIAFRVNAAQRITWVRFKIDVTGAFCEGTVTWEATHLSVPIRADNTFKITGSEGLDTFTVRGEFVARNRARGTAKTSLIGECVASGYTRWSANRVL